MYSTIKLGFMYRKNILLDLIQGKTFLAQDTVLPPTSKQLRFHLYRFQLLSKVIPNTGLVVHKLHLIFLREVKKSFQNQLLLGRME